MVKSFSLKYWLIKIWPNNNLLTKITQTSLQSAKTRNSFNNHKTNKNPFSINDAGSFRFNSHLSLFSSPYTTSVVLGIDPSNSNNKSVPLQIKTALKFPSFFYFAFDSIRANPTSSFVSCPWECSGTPWTHSPLSHSCLLPQWPHPH